MLSLRRLTVAVLAILMVPSLVLVAIPMHYCVSSEGHRALEFVIKGVAHGGEHASHRHISTQDDNEDSEGSGEGAVLKGEKCTDWALFDSVTTTEKHQEIPLPAIVSPIVPFTVSLVQSLPPEYSRIASDLTSPDPGLMARRTTVLRF